jgi:hypothetical protein
VFKASTQMKEEDKDRKYLTEDRLERKFEMKSQTSTKIVPMYRK